VVRESECLSVMRMLRWFRDPSGCTAVSMSSCQPRASKKFIREIAQTDCRLLIVKKDLPIDGAHSDRAASWPKLRSWVASLRICDEHPVGSLPLR
jgi:hypothetical protein